MLLSPSRSLPNKQEHPASLLLYHLWWKAQNFNVCCEKATATEQYVRVNKEEHVCL